MCVPKTSALSMASTGRRLLSQLAEHGRSGLVLSAALASGIWLGGRTSANADGKAIRAPPTCTLLETIGNTPLLELQSLSAATGCRILAKAEYMNPGGSVKDRPALNIIEEAEAEGRLVPRNKRKPGEAPGMVIEATGGNTGLGMALVAAARGYKCIFTMPANISPEKIELMRVLGAEAIVCKVVPFSSPEHYYHRAKALAEATPGSVLGNQFEGLANMRAHYTTTGPEIWQQTGGKVDAIALAAGTGGTIGGLSMFLRERNPHLKVFLIDPPGSSLASFVDSHGADMTANPGSTMVEGIGINRITKNFACANVNQSFRGTDQEALDMAYYLLRREGIYVGPSAALNVVGAVKAARAMGPGHTIVTVLCDGGDRYRSKMYNPEWLKERGMAVSITDFTADSAAFVR